MELKKRYWELLFKIKFKREINAAGIKNTNLKKNNIGKMRVDFNGRLISLL